MEPAVMIGAAIKLNEALLALVAVDNPNTMLSTSLLQGIDNPVLCHCEGLLLDTA
jgi:hypothetical protein